MKKVLEEWADKLSEESKKIIDWLRKQPHPEQYEIIHFINPFTGEHITVHKRGEAQRVYGVFVRFEQRDVKFETDRSFSEK